jgi:beta-lactamase regulating signal transducer with metallopeptidase domain
MMLEIIAESALRSIALGCAAWLGMKLMRVRNPHLQMTVWTVALVVSMTMPLLTPWMRVTIPADQMPAHLLPIVSADVPVIAPPMLLQGSHVAASPADVGAPEQGSVADWRLLATGAYIVAGGAMMVRLLIGLLLMRRVVSAARPVRDDWAAGADVRVSDVVRVPVTFASTILLPSESSAWSERKRLAALLHEGSHVTQLDFYVLLLAAINRAAFWFNPFAWWLHSRLADLAEIISDDAAIVGLDDRRCYAEILLDVASNHQRLPAGLAMATLGTVGRRVERILAATAVSPKICRRKRLLITASLVPLAALSAGTIAPGAAPTRLARATQQGADLSMQPGPAQLDRYVGQFLVTGGSVLTVTRDGAHLLAQVTGEPRRRLIALSDHEFITEFGGANLAFLTDGDGPATAVVLRDPGQAGRPGLRRRARVDAAMASEIEANFKRRVAAVSDRFRDQVPTPGADAALGALIDDMRHDAPARVRMSLQLADRVPQHVPRYSEILSALGAVELIFFRGVGPGGYEIYGVKFANGSAEFRIDLATDGTMEDFDFGPDGDGTLGGIESCALEPSLKSSSDGAPIRLALINGSGADIRLFWLDVDGRRRLSRRTLPNGYSTDVFTNISRPLIVADPVGECREIILPGLLTRVHVIEPPQPGDSRGRAVMPRATAMAGSEQALQRYIEAIRSGTPDYDRMTREAAANAQQLLPQGRAILAKLGELRAMSFRGVSQAGNDVYMVQFANGSAQWQIGLLDDGRIGSVVLGPQY